MVWRELLESVKLVGKYRLRGKTVMAREMTVQNALVPPKKGTKIRPPVGSKFWNMRLMVLCFNA